MARASIFALASHVETFGVVIIESLAAGLPVIATRCGGPDDIVTEGVGWLVAPGDETSLAAHLFEARAKATSMDRCAIAEYARKHYGRERFIARARELYDAAC
jgi:glycosyltransferase involved in cell wall biosynthesis